MWLPLVPGVLFKLKDTHVLIYFRFCLGDQSLWFWGNCDIVVAVL